MTAGLFFLFFCRFFLSLAVVFGFVNTPLKSLENARMATALVFLSFFPPKNGLIALWSATNRWYVVKYFSQTRIWSNIKIQRYNNFVTFILNSPIVYIRLKYVYSVISVIETRLPVPGNTKKWTLVSSWLIQVRLVHSWAGRLKPDCFQKRHSLSSSQPLNDGVLHTYFALGGAPRPLPYVMCASPLSAVSSTVKCTGFFCLQQPRWRLGSNLLVSLDRRWSSRTLSKCCAKPIAALMILYMHIQ